MTRPAIQVVSLKTIVEACPFVLNPVYAFELDTEIHIEGYIHRPGLLLVGYRPDTVPEHHILVMGEDEFRFLEQMEAPVRQQNLENFFSIRPPMIIVCGQALSIPEPLVEGARQHGIPLFHCDTSPREFLSVGFRWLEDLIVPTIRIGGNLMAIFGRGVLIVGPSGIGKSECSLELMARGHRLVADDAVEIRFYPSGELVGRAPAAAEGLMEIRGLGVVDARLLFGSLSVQPETTIDLVVELADVARTASRNRLAVNFDELTLFKFEPFDVGRPMIVLPVVSGRNLGILVETAVRWFMLNARESDRVRMFLEGVDRRASGEGDHE